MSSYWYKPLKKLSEDRDERATNTSRVYSIRVEGWKMKRSERFKQTREMLLLKDTPVITNLHHETD